MNNWKKFFKKDFYTSLFTKNNQDTKDLPSTKKEILKDSKRVFYNKKTNTVLYSRRNSDFDMNNSLTDLINPLNPIYNQDELQREYIENNKNDYTEPIKNNFNWNISDNLSDNSSSSDYGSSSSDYGSCDCGSSSCD